MSARILAVALFLCASFLAFDSAAAQGTSTLTVHARYCDPGEIPDDPFLECHDNALNDWDIQIDGATAGTTDADGNLSLDSLDAGDHELFVPVPLKGTTYSVYCSVAGGDGTFLDLVTSGDGVAVPVDAGVEVICDWYWLISDEPLGGETAPLTIHARICPIDEIPGNIYDQCHDSPLEDIEFFVGGASIGTSGSDGNLVADVSGDTVVLSGGAPGDFANNLIYCSDSDSAEQVLPLTEVVESVEVPMGAAGTTCDWYVIPEDLRGETPTPAPTATADDDDDEVTQLPNTGAGAAMSGSSGAVLLAVVAAIVAIAGSTVMFARRGR